MFRSALVALKPGSSNDAATGLAVRMATERHLKLVGISVVDVPAIARPEAVPLGAGPFKVERDQEMLDQARIIVTETLDTFRGRCQAAGVPCDCAGREGDPAAEISCSAQRADVLVLGYKPEHEDGLSIPRADSAIRKIVSRCPRPVVIAPTVPPMTRRILLAYDGSMQAARALQAFVESGLHLGSELHLLSVLEDAQIETVVTPAMEFLSQHDIPVALHTHSRRQSVAEDILEMASQLQVDLLVMGAYGRPAMIEFFFGSVTRHILERATMPIFLDH
jgi:nucleotide-binding universal stress UspA family protein